MTGIVMVGVAAVAIADVLIKKIFLTSGSFWSKIKHPGMIGVVALYLLQIAIFAYVFHRKAELGIVGIIQTALYALIVIGSGVLFFNEHISVLQGIGIGLAILGVVLMNLS